MDAAVTPVTYWVANNIAVVAGVEVALAALVAVLLLVALVLVIRILFWQGCVLKRKSQDHDHVIDSKSARY